MAQSGQLEEATNLFKKSLIVKRSPQAWLNLAKTHQRLGEIEFAELAKAEYMRASQIANSGTRIQWMPVDRFNASAPVDYQQRIASQPANVPKQASKPKSKTLAEHLKKLF